MVQFDNIPAKLQELNQWVVWKWETRNGKRTKPLYNARTGKLARGDELAQLKTPRPMLSA